MSQHAAEKIPGAKMARRAPTAFFSILKPKTHIPPHTGVTNTRAIIHLPLIIPEGCGFRVGGETREWKMGEAFAFDDTIEHEAWNNSDELRAVLIFDVWNPHLTPVEQTMLQRFVERDPIFSAITQRFDNCFGIVGEVISGVASCESAV